MSTPIDPELDLVVSRVIRAPRREVWAAWSDPRRLERWWVPAPETCRVLRLDLRPGGAFTTEFAQPGAPFEPQIDGCVLAVDEGERLVWTTALLAGWRPSTNPFITAIITMADHPDGTLYSARALHKDAAARTMHEDLGFQDGWGTVTRQLAEMVESGR